MDLNEKAIKECIIHLDEINCEYISIAEIENVLNPLFTGLKMTAPGYSPDTYLYRGRVCGKPIFFHEIKYPPKEYITKYGRANDIGQQMFYAATGKGVPLFELGVKIGDTVALSTWKTVSELIVNHIGFTEEATELLGSKRKLSEIGDFVENTHNVSPLNRFVYNYLANIFTRKIPIDKSYLYKISIAISNKLISTDMLHGIMYPTIAMFGNADNIVLKPSYVDQSLKLVSIEFVRINEVENGEYSYDTIDTSTSIDINGKIEWSGKSLGNALKFNEKISVEYADGNAIAKDENFNRIDPQPTTALDINPTTLLRKFLNAFNTFPKISQIIPVQTDGSTFQLKCALILDLPNKVKFISFYIPNGVKSLGMARGIIVGFAHYLNLNEGLQFNYNEEIIDASDIMFNKQIFIYSECYFDQTLISRLNEELNIVVYFPS